MLVSILPVPGKPDQKPELPGHIRLPLIKTSPLHKSRHSQARPSTRATGLMGIDWSLARNRTRTKGRRTGGSPFPFPASTGVPAGVGALVVKGLHAPFDSGQVDSRRLLGR